MISSVREIIFIHLFVLEHLEKITLDLAYRLQPETRLEVLLQIILEFLSLSCSYVN